jgi:hypothetical protein
MALPACQLDVVGIDIRTQQRPRNALVELGALVSPTRDVTRHGTPAAFAAGVPIVGAAFPAPHERARLRTRETMPTFRLPLRGLPGGPLWLGEPDHAVRLCQFGSVAFTRQPGEQNAPTPARV